MAVGDLITLSEAKAWLKIAPSDTTQDATLELLISSVSESILSYCEVVFELTTVTGEIHDGRRQDTLLPVGYPIHAVTAIYVNVDSDGTNGALLTTEDFNVEPECIKLRTLNLPQGRGLVRIDYQHGYDGVPNRVKLATMIGVEGYYRMRDRKTVGVVSKAKEGESINFQKGWDMQAGLPNEAVSLLAEYKFIEWPTTTAMATRNI